MAIYIGGTGSANKLDDYEQGTWTATFPNGSGGDQAVGTNLCEYAKIGRWVYAFCYLNISGSPPDNGTAWNIGGLPFGTGISGITHHGFGAVTYVGGNSYSQWKPLVTSSARVYFHRTDGSNATLTNAMVRNEGMGYWIMGVNYMIDD